jgi:hypothetical protein
LALSSVLLTLPPSAADRPALVALLMSVYRILS